MNNSDKIPVKITKTLQILACLTFAGFAMLTSCKKEPFEAAYFAFIDDDRGTFAKELQVSPDGGVKTMTIVSNRAWSIDYDPAPWLTISPTSGTGTATITLSVETNETLGQDSTFLNITNNTLLVLQDFKVKRQNYLGTYNGQSLVTSSIRTICTTCVDIGEDSTKVTSYLDVVNLDGKTSLTFSSFVTLGSAAKTYQMDLSFENAQVTKGTTEEGKTAFLFTATGKYDMTGLGEALSDQTVAGEKDTYFTASLSNGELTAEVYVDPAAGADKYDPAKTTVFKFEGSK
jgi:hypothetical protein